MKGELVGSRPNGCVQLTYKKKFVSPQKTKIEILDPTLKFDFFIIIFYSDDICTIQEA